MYQIPIRYVDTKNTKWLCKYLKYEIPNGYVHTKHRQIAAALPWSSLYRARQPERYCARVVHKVNSLLIFVLFFFVLLLSSQLLLFHFPHQSYLWIFILPEIRVFASFPHLVRIDLSDTCIDDRAFDTIGSHCKGLQVKTRCRDVTINNCNYLRTTQSWKGRSWRFPTQR